MTSRTRIGVISALAVLTIWSSFIIVGRLNATGSRVLLPLDIAFLRFVFSGIGVLVMAGVRAGRRAPGTGWREAGFGALSLRQMVALGAFAGMGYCSFVYTGFFFAPAAHASVLTTGSLPLWTTAILAIVVKEPIPRASLVAVSLIMLGDAIVGWMSLGSTGGGAGTWKGDLCFVGASMMWASYTVACRRWRVGPIDATVAIGVSCLAIFVPLFVAAVALGWWPSHLAIASAQEITFQIVFQAGFAMLVAGPAFTQVVASFGALRAAMLTALVPVISALAAIPILGESLRAPEAIGLALVTAGFLVSVWTGRSKA